MTHVLGIDPNAYTELPHAVFDKLANRGVKFSIPRASIGLHIDTCYKVHRQRAADVGMWQGAYHFLHDDDGAAQARLFVDTVHDWQGVAAFADVEPNGSWTTDRATIRAFVAEFRRLLPDHDLSVYSNSWAWGAVCPKLDGAALFDHAWVARYLPGHQHIEQGIHLPEKPPLPYFGGFDEAPLWQWGMLHVTTDREYTIDGDAWYGGDWQKLVGIRPKPVRELPNYAKGWNAQLDVLARTTRQAPDAGANAGPWYAKGADHARHALLEHIAQTRIAEDE